MSDLDDQMRKPFPGVHKIGPLYWMTGPGIGWFRLFGVGLHWNRQRMLFSEREGYTKFVRVGRWRIRYLKAFGRSRR